MAIYVWSGATGSGNGSNWANACTTLSAGLNAQTGQNAVFIAHDHSETFSGDLAFNQGSANGFIRVNCVDRLGSVPPVAADMRETAIVASTGAIYFGGVSYFRGIRWRPGVTGTATAADMGINSLIRSVFFDRCVFDFSGNTGASRFLFSGQGCYTRARDCQWKFNNVNSRIWGEAYAGSALFEATDGRTILTSDSVVPDFLITGSVTDGYTVRGYDLTQFGSRPLQSNNYGKNRFENCRLSSSASLPTIAASGGDVNTQSWLEIVNCHADGGVPLNSLATGGGYAFSDTSTYRVGGSTQDGTPFSWNMELWYWQNGPNRSHLPEGVFWNTVVGVPITLTWEVLSRHPVGLDHLYAEVRYPGFANSALEKTDTTMPALAWGRDFGANQASPFGNLPASTVTWVTPDGFTNKHKISITFTPQKAGLVRWQLFAAQPQFWPEANIYIDAHPSISS